MLKWNRAAAVRNTSSRPSPHRSPGKSDALGGLAQGLPDSTTACAPWRPAPARSVGATQLKIGKRQCCACLFPKINGPLRPRSVCTFGRQGGEGQLTVSEGVSGFR
eukprot:scaffold151860_cov27-Tisochrysis_lutea.AAC.1